MLVFATKPFLQQTFVAANIILSRQNFCCEHIFCCNKSILVVTKLLSQQTCVCHDKYFSQQKYFVMTNNSVVTKVLSPLASLLQRTVGKQHCSDPLQSHINSVLILCKAINNVIILCKAMNSVLILCKAINSVLIDHNTKL